MDKKPWKFAWVDGLRGPTPEKWAPDYNPKDMQGQERRPVLATHNLTEGEANTMTLDALAAVYPLEQKP